MKKNEKVYMICVASMMSALSIILDVMSVKTNSTKITLYSFPLLISGFLFGPWVGLLSGIVSGLIAQVILYGFTITTPLWMVAPMLWGFLSGLLFFKAKKKKYSLWNISWIVVCTSLCVTAWNTLALYIDGLIFQYPTPYVITQLGTRILISMALCVPYIFLLYVIYPRILPSISSNRRIS